MLCARLLPSSTSRLCGFLLVAIQPLRERFVSTPATFALQRFLDTMLLGGHHVLLAAPHGAGLTHALTRFARRHTPQLTCVPRDGESSPGSAAVPGRAGGASSEGGGGSEPSRPHSAAASTAVPLYGGAAAGACGISLLNQSILLSSAASVRDGGACMAKQAAPAEGSEARPHDDGEAVLLSGLGMGRLVGEAHQCT